MSFDDFFGLYISVGIMIDQRNWALHNKFNEYILTSTLLGVVLLLYAITLVNLLTVSTRDRIN